MFNKESKKEIVDSTQYIDWHGYHNGKYYNRSDSRYINEKCSECKKTKPLSAMYAKANGKWICNACIIAREKDKKKTRGIQK